MHSIVHLHGLDSHAHRRAARFILVVALVLLFVQRAYTQASPFFGEQNGVPPTALQEAAMPELASKLAYPATRRSSPKIPIARTKHGGTSRHGALSTTTMGPTTAL